VISSHKNRPSLAGFGANQRIPFRAKGAKCGFSVSAFIPAISVKSKDGAGSTSFNICADLLYVRSLWSEENWPNVQRKTATVPTTYLVGAER
jgi:hypothetical protein